MKIGLSFANKKQMLLTNLDNIVESEKLITDFFSAKLDETKGFFKKRKIIKEYRNLDLSIFRYFKGLSKVNWLKSKRELKQVQKNLIKLVSLLNKYSKESSDVSELLTSMKETIFFALQLVFISESNNPVITKELEELNVFLL